MMLAGLIIVVHCLLTMSICPPLRIRCGCIIGTNETSGSLKAICSDNPELNFNFDCLAGLRPESLDLSGNGLQKVPAKLKLTGFQDLKHLDLSRNKICKMESYNFGAWTRLKSLNISHNCLTDLPVEKAPIRTIDVSYNQLTEMHSIFGLAYTNAIVLGNRIPCKCNDSFVQRMYSLKTTEELQDIECILHDKDTPKSTLKQCPNFIDINTLENPSHFYLFITALIVIIIVIIFLFMS